MVKQQRKQLIKKANDTFGRPFSIRNAETGDHGYYIQTPSDEQMFIDFGNSHVAWMAVDVRLPGYETKPSITL